MTDDEYFDGTKQTRKKEHDPAVKLLAKAAIVNNGLVKEQVEVLREQLNSKKNTRMVINRDKDNLIESIDIVEV